MTLRSIAVLGLARSGTAAAKLALQKGIAVYASDAADNPELQRAAQELKGLGADVDIGSADVDRLAATETIVVSPGIAPHAPPLNDARLARHSRISELEFASRFITAKVAAVTGTNGKSTTSAWAGHMLAGAGLKVAVAGNIGNALSNVAMMEDQPEWVIVEASSFQLADIDRFAPNIGVVTNLSPDHLDRYTSVDAYYGDKKRLFRNASIESIWILNGDDSEVLSLPGDAAGRRLCFRLDEELGEGEHGAFLNGSGELILKVDALHAKLVHLRELKLLGAHNQANALASSLIAIGTGIPIPTIRDGLRTFRGLPHRLQLVAEVNGVQWINDSKATNVASTIVALRSLKCPTVLLLGGRHKGEPYTTLLPWIGNVKTVVAFGEAAAMIEKDLRSSVAVVRVDGPFEKVVSLARELASAGDAVLLSPACSSYDMFRNYEERGAEFARLAEGKTA